MTNFQGETLSWRVTAGCVELVLHRAPCNEIGSTTLREMEVFVGKFGDLLTEAHALIIYSEMDSGFCAGADLRELFSRSQEVGRDESVAGVRDFLNRIHEVMNTIDAAPLTTIAAVNGVCFGGGFELALTCDVIIADKMARFCFPELRLGLIPGFGGIPRLKRDLGNAIVRDLLLTGRSIGSAKAHSVGLVSQVVGQGEALRVARLTAGQIAKFDRLTNTMAKEFIKPIPYTDLRREIDIFCDLFERPAVEAGLRKFVESNDALPYLP
jgi:enoyl-CoA hydratase/carnithine racemase